MRVYDYVDIVYANINEYMEHHNMTPDKIITKYKNSEKLCMDLAENDYITGMSSGYCKANDCITFSELKERVLDNIYKLGQVVKVHAWLDYDHIGYLICEEDYDCLDCYLRLSVLEEACKEYWKDNMNEFMENFEIILDK